MVTFGRRSAWFALIFVICSGFATRVEAAMILFDSPAQSTTVGDGLSFDVNVEGVSDLFAFQFSLTFDPALLQATAVTEGAFLPSGGATFFIPGAIDNVLGSIFFTADSLVSAVPGVNGSGTLARISFVAIEAGTSPIGLFLDPSNGDGLLDSSFGDIATTAVGGAVNINPTQVPEPSTLTLITIGGLLVRARRRHAGSLR